MAFRFKRSNCVLLGTFNMYIIQPPWLAKREIIPKGSEVTIQSKLDEPGFRFFSPKFATRWIVTPSRLEVETEDPNEDCGDAVARVVEALPETPLIALGNNTLYEAPLDESESLSDGLRSSPEIPEGYALVQSTLHYGLKRGESTINVQLARTDKALEIATNVHTELRDRESAFTTEAARRFLADRRESEQLIAQLFNLRVTYDDAIGQPREAFNGPQSAQ